MGKARPSTSAATVVLARDDLSYLPPMNSVVGAILRDVHLAIDTGAPLESRRPPRHQEMEKPVLLDKYKDGRGTEEEIVKP